MHPKYTCNLEIKKKHKVWIKCVLTKIVELKILLKFVKNRNNNEIKMDYEWSFLFNQSFNLK